jgi:hypothetical protein
MRKGRAQMASAYRLFTLAVLLVLAVLLSGCHKTPADSSEPQYIMLTYNAGNCEQNGSTGIVDINASQAVIYQGATNQTEFKIDFTSCPLSAGNCPVNSPNGTSMNVGPPMANAAGSTFMYRSMTVDNLPCKGAQNMGVRVRPAR